MRGKVWFCQKGFVFDGITPAYAGKSFCGQSACISQQDHPRLCGEKEKKAKRNATIEGSPPPMRGKGHSRILMVPAGGITPAYAGKRGRKAVCYNHAEDHPRLCGEKTMSSVFSTADTGSPPPMRGKAEITRTKFDTVGITPAYAGKRFQFPDHRFPCQDHPRLCGEKRQRTGQKHFGEGSPPPMRGKASQWQCL